jgi:ubiquinone/menaquinone biosynthesis C-methylase UbiE
MISGSTLKKLSMFPFIKSALFFFYGRAAKAMSNDLAPYIATGDKVLDLGCGTGIIGSTLAKMRNVSLTGTDVRDVREANIPFALTDGKHLPFPNKAFDIVLISYVLHHVEETETLLKEAARVCRGKIIIYEDTPKNLFHRASCFVHGFSYGSLFGIEGKCKFRTRREWSSLFRKLHLSLVNMGRIEFFNPIHVTARSLFVLSPQPQK